MKKRIWLLLLIVLASILLTGCALQTVDEMYALPKRSKEYDSLQSAIDSAMYGLSYSAPVSGENQQTVQMADLDGDGVEEYIVFAQGNSANPLQVLIFRQEEDGTCRLMEVIQSNGSAAAIAGDFAAGELPDQPGLHGAEHQLPGLGLFPRTLYVVQDPL